MISKIANAFSKDGEADDHVNIFYIEYKLHERSYFLYLVRFPTYFLLFEIILPSESLVTENSTMRQMELHYIFSHT